MFLNLINLLHQLLLENLQLLRVICGLRLQKTSCFKPYTPSESFVPAKTAARFHSLISKSVVKTKTWVDTKPFVRTEWKGVYDVPTSAYILSFQ